MKNTKIMAILNLTPDSFSDGGVYSALPVALKRIEQIIIAGADVLDIGAESTRPGATPLTAAEEWNRLEPVLSQLRTVIAKHPLQISLDTRHAENIIKAVKFGFDFINDVSGFESPELQNFVIKNSDAKIVLMHNLGVPASKKIVMDDGLIIEKILAWAEHRINELVANGLPLTRIILDPGVGFGKTATQSLQLIKEIQSFNVLKTEILVGHSRKSFISLFNQNLSQSRDLETYITSVFLSLAGVDYLRVHDVAGNRRAITATQHLFHQE